MKQQEKSAIKQLCFTDINTGYTKNPSNPRWSILMGAQDELRERFKKGLTESQINMVEELKDIQFDITQIELEHWFYHGFCLGAKVIMEICLEPTTEKPIPTWLLEHLRKVEIT